MLFIFQYDNAVLFCDLGGMPLLVKGLNDTDSSLRSLSAYVLGSAVQRYENKYNVFLHEFYIMLGSAVQRYENKYNVFLHEFYIMHAYVTLLLGSGVVMIVIVW
jgi:hypothetical protein